MRYVEIPPCPRLAHLVKCFWILEDESAIGDAERLVPDGFPEIVLHYGDAFWERVSGTLIRQPTAIVAGQTTSPLWLQPTGRVAMLGIRFLPAGLSPFIRVAQHELTNQRIDLRGLLSGSEDLEEQIRSACDDATRIRLCEQTLLRALSDSAIDKVVERAVAMIHSTGGCTSVQSLARECNVGVRRLERRFRISVGISPKRLCGIVRFRSVFDRLEQSDGANWARIAFDCGYFDQAHLSRDFKQFAGESPSAYLDTATEMGRRMVGS